MFATTAETFLPRPCAEPRSTQPRRSDWAEAGLVRRVQAGDEAAFRELVERYGPAVRRLIPALLRNREDAEDIAQEVFTKVYFAIPRFDARSSLYTWIYRIAVNACYGYLRKNRARLNRQGDCLQDVADERPTAEQTLLRKDFLNKLLMDLPEEDRLLIIWRELEGLSVEELSGMTGLTEQAVKMRLFRTRRRLVNAAARLRSR